MELKGGYMKLFHAFRDYIIRGNFTCNELKILLTIDSLMYGYSEKEPITQKIICEMTGISKNNMSLNIKKLIESGHILIEKGNILLNESFIREKISQEIDTKVNKKGECKVVNLTTEKSKIPTKKSQKKVLKSRTLSSQIKNSNKQDRVLKLRTKSSQIKNSEFSNQELTLINIKEIRKEEKEYCAFSQKKLKINQEKKLDEMFEKFWGEYRQKNGKDKKKAKEIFKRIKPDDQLLDKMLEAIKNQDEEKKILKRRGEFAPEWKMAKTWLNGECWTDEVSVEKELDFETYQKNLREKYGNKETGHEETRNFPRD